MRAWVVTKYKQPLELADLPEPSVEAHDVLVNIHAAAVNLLDAKVQAGEFKAILPYKAPFVLGHDLAGTVIAVGSDVTRFTVGDEVYGRPRDGRVGTFAQRLAVHEDDLAHRPGTISMTEAASVPLVALTAWQALVERANMQPGQKVLIHAGSGGVGTYAIQLAKHLGATVATTTGTTNMRWVKELGADVVIDYKTQRFDKQLSSYDVVLDSQGGETLTRSLTVLKPVDSRSASPDHRTRPSPRSWASASRCSPSWRCSASKPDGPPSASASATRSCSCAPTAPSSDRSRR
jgi:NADPH:quinone reductase-like Zn-dependent oxidoreductase